jgi:hypothetical protein
MPRTDSTHQKSPSDRSVRSRSNRSHDPDCNQRSRSPSDSKERMRTGPMATKDEVIPHNWILDFAMAQEARGNRKIPE